MKELENALNMFLQNETRLDNPVRITSVKNEGCATDATRKSFAKRDVVLSLGGHANQDHKVTIVEVVRNKGYKVSFSRSVGSGTRFHLKLTDVPINVEDLRGIIEETQQVPTESSATPLMGGPNTKRAWTESQCLRQKGWAVEDVSRKVVPNTDSRKLGPNIDRYYYHLISGYRFRSKKEAMEFINEGKLRDKKPKTRVQDTKGDTSDVQLKRGKNEISSKPNGENNNVTIEVAIGDALGSDPKTSMDSEKVEDTEVVIAEDENELDRKSLKDTINEIETNQEIKNEMKESEANKHAIREEHQKDYSVPVTEKPKTHENDEQLDSNVNQMTETIEEPGASARKGKAIVNVSETNNGGLITSFDSEKAGTEENCKEHPQILDEVVSEPDAKRRKLFEGEPFPPEFYTDLETCDHDVGPLWHFDDPYFIELAQVGNPPKDVAYVRLKRDGDV